MREKRNTSSNNANTHCARAQLIASNAAMCLIGVSELKRKIPHEIIGSKSTRLMCSFHCEIALTSAMLQALITLEKFCCTLRLIEGQAQ
jgi:hypothetical protein